MTGKQNSKIFTGLSWDLGRILFVCFCCPKKNDPHSTPIQFVPPTQFGDNPANLFMFLFLPLSDPMRLTFMRGKRRARADTLSLSLFFFSLSLSLSISLSLSLSLCLFQQVLNPAPSKSNPCNMPQAKAEDALQSSKRCAAEVALQQSLFCSADAISNISCAATNERLHCNIQK